MLALAFALAGDPAGTAGGGDGGMAAVQRLIPLIYLFALIYFLRIRPRKKKALERAAQLESIKKDDQAVR